MRKETDKERGGQEEGRAPAAHMASSAHEAPLLLFCRAYRKTKKRGAGLGGLGPRGPGCVCMYMVVGW